MKRWLFFALLLLSAGSLAFDLTLQLRLPSEQDWAEAAGSLRSQARAGDAAQLWPAWAEQARLFVERLRETSKETVAYADLAMAQHAFDLFGSVRSAATAAAIGRFLGVIYGRDQAG